MRILHVSDHYLPTLGGIEIHVSRLAAGQAARGDEVTVLTSTQAQAKGDSERESAVDDVRVCRVTWGLGLTFDLGGFDVVHAHLSVVAPFTAPVAALAARQGVPVVVTVHSLWDGLAGIPSMGVRLSGLRGAPVTWTAVSQVAAHELRRHLPPGTSVQVLPNAVDAPPRTSTPTLRPGPVRLVSTMRIAGRKRPVSLLRMYADLSARTDVPIQLVVLGDGPQRPRLERAAARSGLSGSFRVAGRLTPTEVLATLADADVYVAPALQESFGLAALEARCVGLPVVGYARSGLSEFVRTGTEGMLCRDDADMVAVLHRLVEQPGLRHRISEHNRTVPNNLTWARALSRHEQVYASARGLVEQSAGRVALGGRGHRVSP